MSITLKTKIRYNGQEYASPSDLPPAVRLAYEKVLHDGAVEKRFTFNGQHLDSEDGMPAEVRKLCDDVMGVIENNGEVTIPNRRIEPLLTKKEIAIVGLFAGGIIALVVARIVGG